MNEAYMTQKKKLLWLNIILKGIRSFADMNNKIEHWFQMCSCGSSSSSFYMVWYIQQVEGKDGWWGGVNKMKNGRGKRQNINRIICQNENISA